MRKVLINVLLPVCTLVLTLSGCQKAGGQRAEGAPDRIPAMPATAAMKPAAFNAGDAQTRLVPVRTVSAAMAPAMSTGGDILTCQNDLNSLKQVNDKAWKVRKRDFDSLVASASVYASVRTDVNGKTRDTLDALYRFKTNKLCVQIERDVLDGLVVRGESIR